MLRFKYISILCIFFLFIVEAHAQQLVFKSGKLVTFADQVSLIVEPRNTFNRKARMQVRVYDHNFKLIKAKVTPREFSLPRGGARNVRVIVPFLGQSQKRFRICTERVPDKGATQQVRTRVCGRFYASRVQQ